MKRPIFLLMALFLLGAGIAFAKPVLLMGNAYGRYERERWIEQILNEEKIDYTTSGTLVPVSSWSNYCAVVIADTSPLIISSTDTAQQSAVKQYVENGGNLILVEGGLTSLVGMGTSVGTLPTWMKNWLHADTVGRLTTLQQGDYSVADAHSPWPTDLTLPLTNPDWSSYFYELHSISGLDTHISMLASGTATGGVNKGLVVVADEMSGHVVMLGRMLYRVQTQRSGESATAATARSDSYREAIRRTLLNVSPTRVQAANASQVRTDLSPSHEWVTWRRDAEADVELFAYYDMAKYPRFSPPWPVSAEVSAALRIDLGIGETYAQAFNVFPLSDLSNFTVTAGPVSPATLPSGAVEICKQSAWALSGSMERHEERFWLKPASGASAMKAADTEVYYVKVNSQNLISGTYSLNIQLTDGLTTETIPLTLRVAPVAFPRSSGMKLGLYGLYWANGSLGWDTVSSGSLVSQAYTGSAMAPVLAGEISMGSSSVDGSVPDFTKIKIIKTGQTLQSFYSGTHGDFLLIQDGTNPQVPKLDFSGYDAQLAISQSMGVFRTTFRHGQFKGTSADYIQKLCGEVYVPEDGTHALSDRWKTTFSGIWDQMRWYLRSKGITELNFKYGDELSPTQITQEWLPIARLVRAVGWGPEINLTGSSVSASKITEISPECRVLTINENYADQVLNMWSTHQFYLSPYCKMSTYGSWGYYKSPGFYNRREWWETFAKGDAAHRLSGLDVYTFELMNVFDGTTDFLSVSADGWRTGWNEAAYLQKLRALKDQNASSTDPTVQSWVASVQSFFDNFIAPNKATTPSSPYFHGMYWENRDDPEDSFPANNQLIATSAQMDLSRKDILDLLAACPAP